MRHRSGEVRGLASGGWALASGGWGLASGGWALATGLWMAGCSSPPPEFALQDVNPASARYGEQVSTQDYLEQVSGWYFGHAT